MNFKHGTTAVILVAALAGATGCGARSRPSGEAPDPPSAGAPAATPSAAASAAEAQAIGETVVTVEDFAYELPVTVDPGATVTVINAGQATHTVTALGDGAFEAVVAGDGTATVSAPREPGEYPVVRTYPPPEMSGTLVVESRHRPCRRTGSPAGGWGC